MARRILCLALAVVLARSAFGSGTVTNCTQSDLQAAMAGGGTVLFACSGTITLTNTLTITKDTALDANTNTVVISGGNAVRLFQVASNVNFRATALTLADGRLIGTNSPNGDPAPPGEDVYGAGILSQGGIVILTGCTLTNHVVQGGNAGQDLTNPFGNTGKGGNAMGAAIYSIGGTLNLTNCLITGNAATAGEGSPNGPNQQGDGGDALGGAIFSEDTKATLQGVTLTNNEAVGGTPGAVAVGGSRGRGGSGMGGALYLTSSVVWISNSKLLSNIVTGAGPASYVLSGRGSGDGLGGAMFVAQDSSAVVQLSLFSSNSAAGGIGFDTSLGIPGPAGSSLGGAIFNAGDCNISASTFTTCSSAGGAAGPLGPPSSVTSTAGAGQGGAVYSTNRLVINGSTFVDNLAVGGDFRGSNLGTAGQGSGGAVWSSGLLNATNSTYTANGAIGGTTRNRFMGGPASGGAICVGGGTTMLVNLTIAANRAVGTNQFAAGIGPPGPSQGGGLSITNGSVIVRNSIIANSENGGDVWGNVTDGGYNICSDGTANFSAVGSLNQADPLVSALSNNGGPTATMSLLAGSPARDAIPSGFATTDQRGVSRPQGPAADIGAVEADFISAVPAIVTQPAGETVRAGTNVTLTVGASGTAPLAYQWWKGGNPVTGATTYSLSLSNVQAADAATYSVVVTNGFGTATSQGAVLVVDSTPLILLQPVSVVVSPGARTNFSVVADGPSLAYHWWHNSLSMPGATNPILVLSNALAGAQGYYFVVVSNFAGSITSVVATLSFDASALSIIVPPKDATAETGYGASFSVVASGIPPLAYQWEHNGISIPGATNSSLTFLSVSTNDAGAYMVVVTNGYSSATSPAALLTVTPGAIPPLLAVGRLANNLTITFTAEGGRTYRLLSSSNLTGWASVDTNSAVLAGPLQFVRPITGLSNVFYRVITP